jgi:hypothetical protein
MKEEKTFVHRSAETGEFVSEDYAKANPATTVRETVYTKRGTCGLPEVPEFQKAPPRLVLWYPLAGYVGN